MAKILIFKVVILFSGINICMCDKIGRRKDGPVSLRRLSETLVEATLGEAPHVPSSEQAKKPNVLSRTPQTSAIATGPGLWEDCASITELEKDVYAHLIQARVSANTPQPSIPITRTMQAVAWYHVVLLDERTDTGNASCDSLHSWDVIPPNGMFFKTCCYGPNSYDCMWDKPKEIGGTSDIPFGVEISAYTSVGFDNDYYDGEKIVDLWLNSEPHRKVLLNHPPWDAYTWSGIGVSVKGKHTNVWFISDIEDPNGECSVETYIDNGDTDQDGENGDTDQDGGNGEPVDDETDEDEAAPSIGPCYAVVDELRLIHESPVAVIPEIPSSGACRRIFSNICSLQADNTSLCQAFTYDVANRTCYLMPSASELQAEAEWTSGYTTSCDPPPPYIPPGGS